MVSAFYVFTNVAILHKDGKLRSYCSLLGLFAFSVNYY